MNKIKKCSKCHETKPLDEFHNNKNLKNGKACYCKECKKEENEKYRGEHKEEIAKYSKERYENVIREKRGHLSMYENKSCSVYLGIVIAERLCRHLFKDVEMMPNGFPGYDIICNKGKKINVKSATVTFNHGKNPQWAFTINRNTIADFFILVAFDNRSDLNPLYLWMIPGKEINEDTSKSIALSRIHKWDKWKRSIEEVQICCAEMKKII